MVELHQVEQLLRGANSDVTKLDGDRYSVLIKGRNYIIDGADVGLYLENIDKITSASETQIFIPGHYEHVVQFEGARPRRQFLREGEESQLKLTSRDGVVVEISRPSPLFAIRFFDVDEITREQRRLAFGIGMRHSQEEANISELFRLYTIRVSADPNTPLGKNSKRLHEIAEACIFHFAYGNGFPISFTKTWARTYYWIGRRGREEVQFPLKTYNSDLVGYYNLALSSDSMVLGFLALYKILEYFFSSVTEEELHKRLREKLTAPDFSHTKTKKLRDLSKTGRSFEKKSDELSALKMVLSKYFDKSDLKIWIENYESDNGVYFTNSVEIFSKPQKIDTSENTIVPNIASRIYSIRNAIVHNKESEVSRYVPYSGQEETLYKEIQLLVYLAEQLIMKSGKDISF